MLNVLLAAWGSAGDVHPFLATGVELRRRGHDVTVIALPVFEEAARRAGLSFVPVGSKSVHEGLGNPAFWSSGGTIDEDVAAFMIDELPPVRVDQYYEAIRELDQPGRTVLVSQDRATGAYLANELLGIPMATLLLSPCALPSRHDPPHPPMPMPGWLRALGDGGKRAASLYLRGRYAVGVRLLGARFPGFVVHEAVMERVRRLRSELGPAAAPASSPVRRNIGAWPDWFSSLQPDMPAGTVLSGFLIHEQGDAPGTGAGLPPGVDPSQPPIVFTSGSIAGSQHEFFAAAIEACRILDRPGLLVTRYADQLPTPLPSNVRHLEFAPFDDLLPNAAALVHHGGIGTIAHGIRCGVPQVAKPMNWDQFDNAERMERLGVGKMLETRHVRAKPLTRALRSVLDSSRVRERCAHWRRRMEADRGPSVAADVVEDLAAGQVAGG